MKRGWAPVPSTASLRVKYALRRFETTQRTRTIIYYTSKKTRRSYVWVVRSAVQNRPATPRDPNSPMIMENQMEKQMENEMEIRSL